MMSANGILKAFAAAVFAAWALYTEFRLHRAQDANELLKRRLDDEEIVSNVKSLPNDQLKSELNKDLS